MTRQLCGRLECYVSSDDLRKIYRKSCSHDSIQECAGGIFAVRAMTSIDGLNDIVG